MLLRTIFYPFLILPCLMMIGCGESSSNQFKNLNNAKWVDLTHTYDQATLYWPNNTKGFEHHEEYKGITPGNYFYSSYSISTPEHGGTHLDAPIHFSEKGLTLDLIPIDSLVGNALVIDVRKKTAQDSDYQIQISDLVDWENIHGEISAGSMIFFHTGYGSFYPDRKKYFGTDKKGAEAISELHFPGISSDASTWLVEKRKPKAIGIDTASIDYGQSKDFKTHRILLGNNIPGFENVANLDSLPPKGAFVIALPMKIGKGSGGPLRIVAALPH